MMPKRGFSTTAALSSSVSSTASTRGASSCSRTSSIARKSSGCSEAAQEGPALSVVEATSEQCPHGGQVILIDETEHVLCQGAPGDDGASPEIEVSDATAEECDEGGVVITLDGESWANAWGSSDLRTWLNATFADAFSPELGDALTPITIPWVSITNGGLTTGGDVDAVFIASRTELGGEAVEGDGEVLDGFADPATAAERRLESATPGQYWTRTGMWTTYSGSEYPMSAWMVTPSGDFVSGNWSSDLFGVWPMININGRTLVVQRESDRFEVITLD